MDRIIINSLIIAFSLLFSCSTPVINNEKELELSDSSVDSQVTLPRDFFLTDSVPGKDDLVVIRRGCDSLDDLNRVKPYIDAFALAEARATYAVMLFKQSVRCFDAMLVNPDAKVFVYLTKLVSQTYLGDGRIMQYWEALFRDGSPMYLWFEFAGVKV